MHLPRQRRDAYFLHCTDFLHIEKDIRMPDTNVESFSKQIRDRTGRFHSIVVTVRSHNAIVIRYESAPS